jgi:hypothetical protein
MTPGASTPEELETLFEDACLARDHAAFAGLFEDGAVLAAEHARAEARGAEEIARATTALWRPDRLWLGEPRRVVQARDTALVLGRHGTNVARRGADRRWRYAIWLLAHDATTKEER